MRGKNHIIQGLFCLHNWSITLCGAETWTLRKVEQKHLGILVKVMLEKDGEDQLGRSCGE